MKFGTIDIDLNEYDLILDDGFQYRIVTRVLGSGLHYWSPYMTEYEFKILFDNNIIYTNEALKRRAKDEYSFDGFIYWKFDIIKLREYELLKMKGKENENF